MSGFVSQPLAKHHDRLPFRCGVAELDDYQACEQAGVAMNVSLTPDKPGASREREPHAGQAGGVVRRETRCAAEYPVHPGDAPPRRPLDVRCGWRPTEHFSSPSKPGPRIQDPVWSLRRLVVMLRGDTPLREVVGPAFRADSDVENVAADHLWTPCGCNGGKKRHATNRADSSRCNSARFTRRWRITTSVAW